jgi:hypothetical protein
MILHYLALPQCNPVRILLEPFLGLEQRPLIIHIVPVPAIAAVIHHHLNSHGVFSELQYLTLKQRCTRWFQNLDRGLGDGDNL